VLTIDTLDELKDAGQPINIGGDEYYFDAIDECNGDCGWRGDCIAGVDLTHADYGWHVEAHLSETGDLIPVQP